MSIGGTDVLDCNTHFHSQVVCAVEEQHLMTLHEPHELNTTMALGMKPQALLF